MSNQYTFEDLFLRLSLYEPFSLEENNELIQKLGDNDRSFTFDCYCIDCKKESTFRLYSNEFYRGEFTLDTEHELHLLNRFQVPKGIYFNCQRDPHHQYSYFFIIQKSEIKKIGQYPSVADIEIPGIQKYQKLLKQDYKDFSKAIGLHSHGVGAGSFVYLRRIFENLIEEKHVEASQNDKWDEKEYQKSRMDEKINLLKDKLPPILVEHRSIYGIMSKGIHQLSEDECKTLFPDVKLGIELILDEKLYELEKQSKRKSYSNFIANTAANLK
ncbi:hypothetical protein [Lysinibacillus sp. NPDC093216]|uniref:hypothetical protein n=1 Tax=Lysinibacillus sp. NPDC093216 TaxID=3390576 RepID=UPI003D066424